MSELAVGGQAVIEGVMMRSPKALAVAVRRPSGEIAVREMTWRKVFPDWKFLRWPLLRGAVVLIESMANGMKVMQFAGAQALGEEEEEKAGAATSGAIAFAGILAVLLFVAAPHYSASWVGGLLGVSGVNSFAFHLLAGSFKIAIFFGYVMLLGQLPDMKRIFQYHGAEHKSIYAFEAGLPLTVENARRQTRFHPRCGTAFIFAVAGIAILFWSAVFPFLAPLLTVTSNGFLQNLVFVAVKIPMMFPIAGLAYEFTRLGARKECGPVIRFLTAPGLWLQRLTTREPDDSQLEIALVALRQALAREKGQTDRAPENVVIYPSYQAFDLPVA